MFRICMASNYYHVMYDVTKFALCCQFMFSNVLILSISVMNLQ